MVPRLLSGIRSAVCGFANHSQLSTSVHRGCDCSQIPVYSRAARTSDSLVTFPNLQFREALPPRIRRLERW